MTGPTLKIKEIFKSIQGEGILAGKPMAFVRILPWSSKDDGESLSFSEIIDRVKAIGGEFVCLAGDDPSGVSNAPALMETLLAANFGVCVEIPGSRSVRNIPARVTKLICVECPDVSPEPLAWENFDLVKPFDQIKFNVASQADFTWAQKICLERGLAEKCLIFFSPVQNRSSAADLAKWMLAEEPPLASAADVNPIPELGEPRP